MTNGATRKYFARNPYVQRRRKNIKTFLDNKENLSTFTNIYSSERNASQYLYADPSFIMEAINLDYDRPKGGRDEQDVFYDCLSCENEDDTTQCIFQQQLQLFEVINEMKNAKQFKGLLKQMALTSNIVYRTFKHAYNKTKNRKQKKLKKNFDLTYERLLEEFSGDFERENKKANTPPNDKHLKGEKYLCYNYPTHPKLDNMPKENICPVCLGYLEEETVICCEKFPQRTLKPQNVKNFNDTKTEEDEMDSGLVETIVCDQYVEDLNFCERCAVLRGAMPEKAKKQPLHPNLKTPKSPKETQASNKQVLNLNPVSVTIPLKLQIDGENCQSRFVETEIVMETFGAQSKTVIQKPADKEKPTSPIPDSRPHDLYSMTDIPAVQSAKISKKSNSDTFYSCISSSGIIKPIETQDTGHEKALNEIFELIKNRLPTPYETVLPPPPAPIVMIKKSSVGVQMTPPDNKIDIPPISSKTNYSQTAGSTPSPFDPKMKARADLLEEVRAALHQTTTILALKSLREGKRFSLPTELRPKETPNVQPARHSFPTSYQATPKNIAPLRPLDLTLPPIPSFTGPKGTPAKREIPDTPGSPTKPELSTKPELFPKPKLPPIPPKPAQFPNVQTDTTGIIPSEHYTRNDVGGSTPSPFDPKINAQRLRADLLDEVRTALNQTTTIVALKTLREGKRFSLPTELRPKETPNVQPARHSFPTSYQATPKNIAPLRPLDLTLPPIPSFTGPKGAAAKREIPSPPGLPTNPELSTKPELPPKPKLPPEPPVPPKPVQFANIQTDKTGIVPSGHYKRNDVRGEIQDKLKDLLEQEPPKTPQNTYTSDEREEILLDLHRLFHPTSAGLLPKQISCENALEDIRYILDADTNEPEKVRTQSPKRVDSQDRILESVRYILNPKNVRNPKKRKYPKHTKDKILEDLQVIVSPRNKRPAHDREIRSSVLHDLRFMLDTGEETLSPQRPPRTGFQPDADPSSSKPQPVRSQEEENINELRHSLQADLKFLLDSSNVPESSKTQKTKRTSL